MIQRPQSLLLLLAAICYVVMAFSPLWSLTVEASTVHLSAFKGILTNTINGTSTVEKEISTIYLSLISLAGAALTIFVIFLYKNRPLQATLSAVNSLFITIFIGLTLLMAIPKCKEIIMSQGDGTYLWGFYLAPIILLANFVANRLIRKDEALVKSVDRIR